MSLFVIGLIGLAIGASTAIFSIADQTLLRPVPFVDPDRLVDVIHLNGRRGSGGNTLSPMKIAGWQSQPSIFERFEAYWPREFDVTGSDEPLRVRGLTISTGLLSMLGVLPSLGRNFVEGEGRPDGQRVVLISNRFWRSRFGGTPDALGREVFLNDQPYTVIGVMPRRFQLLSGEENLYLPLDVAASTGDSRPTGFYGLARLRRGLSPATAQVQADLIADRLQVASPIPRSWYLRVEQKQIARVSPPAKAALWVLVGAVAFVLLIACANIASLLLTSNVRRGREMAVRAALGASRGRLIRQVFFEGMLLAGVGGALGMLIGTWMLELLLAIAPERLVFMSTMPVEVDDRVLIVAAALSLLAGLLFSLIPAIRGSRQNLMPALHGVVKSIDHRTSFGRVPSALIVGEVAFSLVLLLGAVLMIRTMISLRARDLGFDPRNVVSMEIGLATDRYPTMESRSAFFDELSRRLKQSGRIETVAVSWGAPAGGIEFGNAGVEGSTRLPEAFESTLNTVTPGFLGLLRIPLLEGRDFVAGESVDSVIVSRAFADRFWPNESPFGRRFRGDGQAPWQTVVGVVGNVDGETGNERTALAMYRPWPVKSVGNMPKPVPGRRGYDRRTLLVRGNDPLAAVPIIKAQVWGLDKDQAVERIRLLEDLHAETFGNQRFVLWLMGAFACVAVMLATTGLFGMVSQAVLEQRREIGIRIALGASPQNVLNLIVMRGFMLTTAGVLAGIAGGWVLSGALEALIVGVTPHDVASFAIAGLFFVFIATLACWLPARAAMSVEPAFVLRTE
jgi:predicted permease